MKIRFFAALLWLIPSLALARQGYNPNDFFQNTYSSLIDPSSGTVCTASTPCSFLSITGSGGTVNQGTAGTSAQAWYNQLVQGGSLVGSGNGLYVQQSTALPAGTNAIGTVTTPDALQSPSASFTRPANTTAYVAGYLVANSTTAGSVVAPSWANLVRAAGDCVRIERIRMTATSGSITNGSFRVYIFNSAPTVTSGDGAAFDASGVLNTNAVDNMAGNFNVTFGYSGSDGAVGWGVPANGTGVTACPTSGTAIYALVEATGAWTPPSASVITLYPELYKP